MKIKLLFTTLLLFCLTAINAAPFKNVEKILTQPDGTKLHCYASGDEFYSRLHDKDGYTIVQAENGYFVYATTNEEGEVIATQHIAGKADPKALGLVPNIKISQKEYLKKRDRRKPSLSRNQKNSLNHGVYNNLVVFIKFKDDPDFRTSNAEMDSMFNHNGYHAISMNNYFKKATYNKLSMNSYCYPKTDGDKIMAYEDIYPRNYYIPYNKTTNPDGYKDEDRGRREFALLKRAIEHIADEVPDTLNLDRNEDGLVDNVIFVVKGNVGDWSDLLWPHMWEMHGEDVYIHNKKVMGFNFQLETSTYFTVSTLCHEMAHSLGFPDLYHYDPLYDHLLPSGPWDLMCSNSQPPQHTATYMKYKYGTWIDEIPEIGYGTYTLEANSWEGGRRNCYKIPTSDPNQFYLVEYRNKNNTFEKGLPDGGMLIYRLDTRFNGCIEYNGKDILDELYIFRPGGTHDKDGNINFATFSADNNRTKFNSSTDPYPFLNIKKIDADINICNISTRGDKITFSYLPKNSDIIPTNFIANVNKDKYVELQWDTVANADSYNVYRDGILISSNITDNFYKDEYNNIEKGYHKYYVSSNSNGTESFRSNKEEVIIGDYCEYIFDMNCTGDNGWQGGEITVSFNNGMEDIYITMYSGNSQQESIVVPEGVEMNINWTPGWDDTECSFTLSNNEGELYKSNKLEEGLLTSILTESEISCVQPQNLTANAIGAYVDLQWTSHVENEYYVILRNDEIIADDVNANSYTDRSISGSGTYTYAIMSKNGDCLSKPSEPVIATIMNYNKNILDIDATSDGKIVKLDWSIDPDKCTHSINYDDGKYVTSKGSSSNTWGIMIPTEKLSIYEGAKITAIEIFDATETTYNFNIYNGDKTDSNSLLHSEAFSTSNTNEFVTFKLSKEVEFDTSKNLWLSVKAISSTNAPIPCGKFIGDENSNLIKSGVSWKSACNYDINYSWLIRFHIEQDENFVNNLSYNVYKENELVASNIKSTTYTDPEEKNIGDTVCYNISVIYNNANIIHSDDICIDTTSNTDSNLENEYDNPRLYPNPTKNYVTISDNNNIESVKIYSITGAMLYEKITKGNKIEIDMSIFEQGIYLIQVTTENETKTYKLVRS